MAVTNAEIILTGMLEAGLDPETVVVNTYAGWNRLGYQVKKGETAVFKTRIWKPSKVKKDDSANTQNTDGTQTTDGNTDGHKNLILVPAAFFTQSQVEKAKPKTGGKQ